MKTKIIIAIAYFIAGIVVLSLVNYYYFKIFTIIETVLLSVIFTVIYFLFSIRNKN